MVDHDEVEHEEQEQQQVEPAMDLLDPRRFVTSEPAQVWARDTRTGAFRYLPDGEADDLREIVRAHWACPVPECPSPAFTSVGGSRRHHLRHQSGGGHTDTESVDHIQAKAMLVEWATGQDPEATVAVEQRFGMRRADVAVTWPDAWVAFEVEYKNGTEKGWVDKHRDYTSTGITDAWLFGHTSDHVALTRGGETVRLGVVARAAAARGLPVLAVNPHDRTIGTVVMSGESAEEVGDGWWESQKIRGVGRRLPETGDSLGSLVVCSIDECRLDPEVGLITPVMDEIGAERSALAAAGMEAEEAWRANRAVRAAHEADEQRRRRAEQAMRASSPSRVSTGLGIRGTWDPARAHCVHCAYREAVGLPVRQPSPGYQPWCDANGNRVAEPPVWWPGGYPLRPVGAGH